MTVLEDLAGARPLGRVGGPRRWLQRARERGWLALLSRAVWPALVPGSLLFAVLQIVYSARLDAIGLDSHAYWLAARHPETWYSQPPGYRDAFLYSPAFGQLLGAFGGLPWPVFQVLWALAGAAILAWLLRPLGWRGVALAPFFVSDLLLGNVYFFLDAALVLSLGRWPGALALPLLTKVAPGVVGVWFVARRDWRAAAWAAGTTGAIVLVSVALSPDAWLAWLRFLGTSAADGTGSVVRLVFAVVLAAWAARRNQAWLLSPAMILASPVLGGYGALAILAAIPRLLQWQRANHTLERR